MLVLKEFLLNIKLMYNCGQDYFHCTLTLISQTETRNKQRGEHQAFFLSLGPPPHPLSARESTATVQTYCTENSKQRFPEMKRILYAVCIGEHVPAVPESGKTEREERGAFVTLSADEKGGEVGPSRTTARNFGHFPLRNEN